ncbi:hypothetical protein Tco_0136210, partial [Tanacetum coccineum]
STRLKWCPIPILSARVVLERFNESSSRSSSESRRKTHHNLRRISTSEEKNQDQDDGVSEYCQMAH